MRVMPRRRPNLTPLLLALAGGLALARPCAAAPRFVTCGRMDQLQKLVVAQSPAGPVTALDVLFYLDMARSANASIPVEDWLAKTDERDPKAWERVKAAVEEYLAVEKLSGRWTGGAVTPPAAPAELRRDLLHSAAEAAWIDVTIVQPGEIVISDADVGRYYITHPEKYGAEPRVQVRCIFSPIEDTSDVKTQRAAVNELGQLRDRVLKGELTFAAAARQFSKAPSAAQGGLLPEFTHGTFFPELEFQAFALSEVGDVSPAFAGKGGAYLLQLVGKTEAKRVPRKDVEAEIREELRHDLVASYYRYFLARLAKRDYVLNLSSQWSYLNLKAPIASLGGKRLERDQVIRANPQVVNASYDVQASVVQKETTEWIEGEAITQDLERRKRTDHLFLRQASQIADMLLAAKANLNRAVPISVASSRQAAVQTLGLGEGAIEIQQSRVVEILVKPDALALKQPGVGEVVNITMRQLAEKIEKGLLPTRPEPTEFANSLVTAVAAGEKEFRAEIKRLESLLETSQWSNVAVTIKASGWKNSSPILAWNAALIGLAPGRVSTALPSGINTAYYLVVQTRQKESPDLVDAPSALQTMAYDKAKVDRLVAEIKAVQAMNLLKIEAPKPPAPPAAAAEAPAELEPAAPAAAEPTPTPPPGAEEVPMESNATPPPAANP